MPTDIISIDRFNVRQYKVTIAAGSHSPPIEPDVRRVAIGFISSPGATAYATFCQNSDLSCRILLTPNTLYWYTRRDHGPIPSLNWYLLDGAAGCDVSVIEVWDTQGR